MHAKKIELKAGKSLVMNRHQVRSFVSHSANQTGIVLSPETMQAIYDRLYPYTQLSTIVKQKHVDDIIVSHTVKSMTHNQSVLHPEVIPVKQKQAENRQSTSPMHEELKPEISKSVNEMEAGATAEAVKLCPICGKAMVLRTAKKGKNAGNRFWGCSGFPRCRYTENIAEIAQKE